MWAVVESNNGVLFSVINKGQVMTQYYRFMNKNGGYTWVQTCATVVCNSKNAEEQNVICVNYVIRYVADHGRFRHLSSENSFLLKQLYLEAW
jgi:NADH:ubiquinone oxidoreductase subunit E